MSVVQAEHGIEMDRAPLKQDSKGDLSNTGYKTDQMPPRTGHGGTAARSAREQQA